MYNDNDLLVESDMSDGEEKVDEEDEPTETHELYKKLMKDP